jgi:hypothetical protein
VAGAVQMGCAAILLFLLTAFTGVEISSEIRCIISASTLVSSENV